MSSLEAHLQGAAKRAAQDRRINLDAASSFFHALLQLNQEIHTSDAYYLRHTMSVLRHTPDPAAVANTYTYDKLEPAVRQLIDLWEQEPLYIGTEAHKRAKVRLIRDLLNQGKLDEAVERGILTVANCVREQAEDATFVGENGENVWHFPGPELIKMKELRLEGFERTIDLKAQTLVGEAEGTPQWRLDFENWEKENRERNRTKREMMQKRKERRQKRRKQKRRQKEEAAEARK